MNEIAPIPGNNNGKQTCVLPYVLLPPSPSYPVHPTAVVLDNGKGEAAFTECLLNLSDTDITSNST